MKKFFQTACAAVVIMMCAVLTANAQKTADQFKLRLDVAKISKRGNSSTLQIYEKTSFNLSWDGDDPLYCQGKYKNPTSIGLSVIDSNVEFYKVNAFTVDNNVVLAIHSTHSGVEMYQVFCYPKEKLVPTTENLTAIKNNRTGVFEPAKIIKSADGGMRYQSVVKGSSHFIMLNAKHLSLIKEGGPDIVKSAFASGTFPFVK